MMSEPAPIVFFSRCKPCGVDAIDIALDNDIIFFGYPMVRKYAEYDRHSLRSCIVDPNCQSDAEWEEERRHAPDNSRQYRQNRNFVRKVSVGSIAMIPEPSRGVIHCGRVDRPFELVNDPPWYDHWERLWSKANPKGDPLKPSHYLASEVAQTWHVAGFQPIPVPRIPAWIRRSLFGRSTYGVVAEDGLNPHDVMSDILVSPAFPARGWTADPNEVASRLKTDLVPASFEHLVVSLLQLEHPEEIWTQVGGSGDGGIDGIGADETGDVTGLLQCKWAFWGGSLPWPEVWGDGKTKRRYVASLIHQDNLPGSDSYTLLGKDEIVRLVLKHAARLPLALSLRIGDPIRST